MLGSRAWPCKDSVFGEEIRHIVISARFIEIWMAFFVEEGTFWRMVRTARKKLYLLEMVHSQPSGDSSGGRSGARRRANGARSSMRKFGGFLYTLIVNGTRCSGWVLVLLCAHVVSNRYQNNVMSFFFDLEPEYPMYELMELIVLVFGKKKVHLAKVAPVVIGMSC